MNLKHEIKQNIAIKSQQKHLRLVKKQPKAHLEENVQVFTDLPPKVDGTLKCYLKVKITKINWLLQNDLAQKQPHLAIRILWWGEDGSGSVFRPKVIGLQNNDSNRIVQTTAKYQVKSGPKQLTAYLNDMNIMEADLIDEKTMRLLGKAQINEITQLSLSNPINGYYSVYNEEKTKLAEIHVNMKFESLNSSVDSSTGGLNGLNINDSSIQSTRSRSNSLSKYNENNFKSKSPTPPPPTYPFTSTTTTTFEHSSNTDTFNNTIIKKLLDKGKQLKDEMIKSALNTQSNEVTVNNMNNSNGKHHDIDMITYNMNREMRKNDDESSFDKRLLNLVMNDRLKTKYNLNNSLISDMDEQESDLSDPIHDTQILTKLFYDDHLNNSSDFESYANRRSRVARERSSHVSPACSKSPVIKNKMKIRSRSQSPSRSRSSSVNSNIRKKPQKKPKHRIDGFESDTSDVSRVSFDMPHSDLDDSINTNTTTHNDGLTAERITVLGHVHVARVYIDKMNIILNTKSIHDYINAKFSDPTKPPRDISNTQNVTYFIEYQFPVIANSRDQQSSNEMATEVMRVASKRHLTSNIIIFSHRATFPILFNGNVIEKWWKSSLQFKLYSRLSNMKAPILIGLAMIPLKIILKSENLKLDKTITIKDRYNNKSKLGTIDCIIELTSDSKNFENDLVKLKLTEGSQKNLKLIQVVSNHQNVQKETRVICESSKKRDSSVETHRSASSNKKHDDDDSVQIQLYLSVNEGRSFISEENPKNQIIKLNENTIGNTNSTRNLFLVCRLFWCDEKIRSNTCWSVKSTAKFNLNENITLFLNRKVLNQMHNNFMIIEIWNKKLNQNDILMGIVKIPLNQFYVTFKDEQIRDLFFKKSKYPCISVDNWLPCVDPFSGHKTCEIEVILAMGTNEQITNLQTFKFNKELDAEQQLTQVVHQNKNDEKFLTEFLFEIKIDSIKQLKLFDNMIWGETDCYVQYLFPVVQDNSILTLKTFRSATTLCIPDMNLNECLKHSIRLSSLKNLKQEIFSLYNSTPGYMIFEIWLRFYHPNVRDQIIGKCFLDLNKFCSLFTMDQQNLIEQSFLLNIYSIDDNYESSLLLANKAKTNQTKPKSDYGDLNIRVCVNKRVIKGSTDLACMNRERLSLDQSQICVNVGVLRACGLKSCVKFNTLSKNLDYIRDIGMNVYVKVKLHEDIKQTRTIARSFVPEFYHYFDYVLPLLWSNEHTDTISLAQILETLNVDFEIYHQASSFDSDQDGKNKQDDVLIGICSVSLKDLLLKQTGIKGWIPIKLPEINNKWSIKEKQGDISTRFNGGLEVLIRFAQETDRQRVLNTAKQYGWLGNDSYFFDYTQINDNLSDSNKNYLFSIAVEHIQLPQYLAFRIGETKFDTRLKCYLRYKFYDCNQIITKCKHLEQCVDENYLKCTFKFTSEHVVRRSAPLLWYLNEEKFEIQIWLSVNDEQDGFKEKPNENDKYLGSAFVDMTKFNDEKLKDHRLSGLYPIFKPACKELSAAYCQVYISLEKLDDFQQSKQQNAILMKHNNCEKMENIGDDGDSKTPVNSFKCIIGIERALHLPKIYDKLTNRHIPPNPYVTYACAKTTNLSQTQIIEQQTCPIWNYQELTYLNVNNLFDETKCLVLKVWHKINPDLKSQSPEKSADKVLGFVSIDLCPLLSGLQQITGWYNIIDMIGQCQGQLKISIIPQDNLLELKRLVQGHKNVKVPVTSKIFNFNDHLQSNLQPLTKTVNNEDSCLKVNLRKQLDELDKINEKLKEKLVSNSETQKSVPLIVPTKNTDNVPLNNVIEQHVAHIENAKEMIKKANDLLNKSPVEPDRVLDLPPIHDKMKSKSNDSFWVSKLNMGVHSSDGGSSVNVNSVSSSIRTSFENLNENNENNNVNHLVSFEVEDVDDENNSNHDDDDDENQNTDLDQTNNFINNYDDYNDDDDENGEVIEIRPLNSVSGMDFDKNYQVNTVNIQNLELITETNADLETTNEVNNENNNNITNENSDSESESEEIVIECDDSAGDDEICLNKDVQNVNDEKISEKSNTPKINIEFSNRPLPNFFLPPEDLEKNMRQLHLNYKKIDEPEVTLNETNSSRSNHSSKRLDDVANRLKAKSPANTIPDNFLNTFKTDKDLDRLNKIFRAKFNNN